jgi:DNA-binding NtrC family response regulator
MKSSVAQELEARCRQFADELAQAIKRAVLGAVEDALGGARTALERSPAVVRSRPRRNGRGPAPRGPRSPFFDEIARQALEHALARTNGHRVAAAKLLGISKSTLYRKLEATGIDPDWTPSAALIASAASAPVSIEGYERAAIERALASAGGRVLPAAQELGLSRSALYRLMEKRGLAAPSKAQRG